MNKEMYYLSSKEYIIDLLKLLDLKIHRLILAEDIEAKGLNPFKGLAITESEVVKILDRNNSEKTDTSQIDDEIKKAKEIIEKKLTETNENNILLSFDKICSIFNLNPIEINLLLIGISVEIDPKYEKIYGYIQDNISKKRPSIDLALRLLNLSNIEKIDFRNRTTKNSFFKMFILEDEVFDSNETFLSSELIIHDKIIDYLLENDRVDPNLEDLLNIYDHRSHILDSLSHEAIIENVGSSIRNFLEDERNYNHNLFIYIHGNNGVGKKHIVKSYFNILKKDSLIVDIGSILAKEISLKNAVKSLIREAILREASIVFENFHILEMLDNKETAFKDFYCMLEYFLEPVFILSQEEYRPNKYFNKNSVVVFKIDRPNFNERKELWKLYSRHFEIDDLNQDELAAKFNFTPLQIRNTIKATKTKLLSSTDFEKAIYDSCYEQVDNKLTEKAVKVNTTYTWDQLILAEEQKKLLKDACNQVKNRYVVYEEWGFGKKVAYGKGLSIICAGPPGTGKTMSAQVMANELNLELYKIDLSQVVSKYVGETEKNLHVIFEEASLSNAILFFDEGDALFGKRSEVRSSNDRFANIETSYLLQKIEEYEGVTILTTNFLKNIDKAFLRRINFIVNFPFPDSISRKKIWEITLPDKAPIENDMDFEFLADTFEVAGGNIKNIIEYSAFLAAQEKEKITMRHILFAAKYELQKMDKLLLKDDLGEYRYLID
ncbi:AAA family ATPase [Wukongibacter baidiensis]|uniref:ATP-binding protein n=1 Tax=Wukongibacter baidiensis TaxID=1723361 RepID=UPI003D7F7443